MQQYIYGASVHGIQSFIFQTNKLKEIVGASQLVGEIFNKEFKRFCKKHEVGHGELNIVMSAAGKIKLIAGGEDCRKIVKHFPMHISNYAPGLTLSQAVVKYSDNVQKDIATLEQKLSAQRGQSSTPIDIGFMGLERARRTGGVAYDFDDDNKHCDAATKKKIDIFKNDPIGLFRKFKEDGVKPKHIPFNVEHITKDRDNAWLAIIHADGNGLGNYIRNLLKNIKDRDEIQNTLSDFSINLEKATCEAAQEAFEKVVPKKMQADIEKENGHYPLRPVILGGDDLTVIIRADLAFEFTKTYLKAFEKETKDKIGEKLTACAGIAYVKQNYPFHYGVHLAESLTTDTKNILKKLNDGHAPSALNFYKVQSSFLEDLPDMKARTHFAEASKVSFDYGPYLVTENIDGLPHIDEMGKKIKTNNKEVMLLEYLTKPPEDEANGVAKLRQWSAELHKDISKAKFMKERMKLVNAKFYKALDLDNILVPIKKNGNGEFITEADNLKFKSAEKTLEKTPDKKSIVNDLLVLSSF